MEKAKISVIQLFVLMVLYELGSALLVPLAIELNRMHGLQFCLECWEVLLYF